MRLFCDTNIAAPTVAGLRALEHDVIYSAERPTDPGDAALLAEAHAERRTFVTKDHDIGALVFQSGASHAGIILLDDLGDPAAELRLILSVVADCAAALTERAFIRAALTGVRIGA